MDMTQPYEVPSGRVARGRVTAPPSKSHAIRALVCAALAGGTSTLHGLSRCDADDVQKTIGALRTLGFTIDGERVTGAGGRIPNPNVTLDLGGSATAFRFLTAVAALGPGPTTLTGDASLRRRPMDSIVDPLRQLGANVVAAAENRAPLVVTGGRLRGGRVDVDASETSQSASAMLLVGSALSSGLDVHWQGDTSREYLLLTYATLRRFGCSFDGMHRVLGPLHAARVAIEGDWSSAAYLLAAAAATRGDVEVAELPWHTRQADRRVLKVLRLSDADVEQADSGVAVRGRGIRPLDASLHVAPDLAPLVGAIGCVAEGTTRVRGAAHLRIKESDRIATVVAAARALGCPARELPDGFEIDGPARHGGLIATHHDHRLAMAFAVAGLAIPGVVIDDPACVAKSYPGFWRDLKSLISV